MMKGSLLDNYDDMCLYVRCVQTKRSKTTATGPINGLHPDHTHHALLALDILNWMTVSISPEHG